MLAVAGATTRASVDLGFANVLYGGVKIAFSASRHGPEAGDHFVAGERGEGQGGDELLGRFGHHHVHIQRLALQGSHDFGRLISGNATRDTDSDLHSVDCTTEAGQLILRKHTKGTGTSGAKAPSFSAACVGLKAVLFGVFRKRLVVGRDKKGTGFSPYGTPQKA